MVCMYAISYTHPPSSIYHAMMHEGPFLFLSIHWEQSGVDTVQPMRYTTPYMVLTPMRKITPYTVLKSWDSSLTKICLGEMSG